MEMLSHDGFQNVATISTPLPLTPQRRRNRSRSRSAEKDHLSPPPTLAASLARAQLFLLQQSNPDLLQLKGQMVACKPAGIKRNYTAVLGQNPRCDVGGAQIKIIDDLKASIDGQACTSPKWAEYQYALAALTGHNALDEPTSNIIPIASPNTESLLLMTGARNCSELACLPGIFSFLCIVEPTCVIISGNSGNCNLNSSLPAWFAAMQPEDFVVLDEALFGTVLNLSLVKINIPTAVTSILEEQGLLHAKCSLVMVVAGFHHFSYHLDKYGFQYQMEQVLTTARKEKWSAQDLFTGLVLHAHARSAESSAHLASHSLSTNVVSSVLSFLSSNQVEFDAALELLQLHPYLQRVVLAQGSLHFAKNASPALRARIRKVRSGNFDAMAKLPVMRLEAHVVQQFCRLNSLQQHQVVSRSLQGARDINAVMMHRILASQFGKRWRTERRL